VAEVRSPLYPQLRVPHLNVQFRDGVADVKDPKVLAKLRDLGSLGVVVPEPASRPKPAKPRKSAIRKPDKE
jgi:hypothetical protein